LREADIAATTFGERQPGYGRMQQNFTGEITTMSAVATTHPTVVRTERGLSMAGTRITLYDLMDYVTAGWPPRLIRDRLNLSDEQIADAVAYIEVHRAEVEADYQNVLQAAAENRQYWEARNRARLDRIAALPFVPDQEVLRAKLKAWKDRLEKTG
jgi:hypothetical protein